MDKSKHSKKKYWIVLVCWFFSPLLIKRIFANQTVSEYVVFALIALYWTFVIISFAHEHHLVVSYLKTHYPYEVKRRENHFAIGGGDIDISFIFSFSPDNDDEWKKIQVNFREYFPFPFVSFGVIPLYVILYLILKI